MGICYLLLPKKMHRIKDKRQSQKVEDHITDQIPGKVYNTQLTILDNDQLYHVTPMQPAV